MSSVVSVLVCVSCANLAIAQIQQIQQRAVHHAKPSGAAIINSDKSGKSTWNKWQSVDVNPYHAEFTSDGLPAAEHLETSQFMNKLDIEDQNAASEALVKCLLAFNPMAAFNCCSPADRLLEGSPAHVSLYPVITDGTIRLGRNGILLKGAPPDGEVFQLPDDYPPEKLLKDFGPCSKTHAKRMANRQKRWEMYCSIATLIRRGSIPSMAKALHTYNKKLDLDRGQLGKIIDMMEAGPMPLERPGWVKTGIDPNYKPNNPDVYSNNIR